MTPSSAIVLFYVIHWLNICRCLCHQCASAKWPRTCRCATTPRKSTPPPSSCQVSAAAEHALCVLKGAVFIMPCSARQLTLFCVYCSLRRESAERLGRAVASVRAVKLSLLTPNLTNNFPRKQTYSLQTHDMDQKEGETEQILTPTVNELRNRPTLPE
jgi:hypothetical protein